MRLTALRLAPRADATVVEVDGEGVLIDESTGHLHWLDSSALLLWQCLDGESTLDEIAHDIAEVSGAPYEGVVARAEQLAEYLSAYGLVVDPDAPADDHGHHHDHGHVHDHGDGQPCGSPVVPDPPDLDPRLVFDPPNY